MAARRRTGGIGSRRVTAQQAGDELWIQYVSLDELAKWPANPKRHDELTIRDSLGHFGYVAPIIIDELTLRIVAGHGRLDTLQSMRSLGEPPPRRIQVNEAGEWMVPVLRGVTFPTEEEAAAYLIADNQTTVGSDFLPVGMWHDELLPSFVDGWDATMFSGTEFHPGLFPVDDESETLTPLAPTSPEQADSSIIFRVRFRAPHEFDEFCRVLGIAPPERPRQIIDGAILLETLRNTVGRN